MRIRSTRARLRLVGKKRGVAMLSAAIAVAALCPRMAMGASAPSAHAFEDGLRRTILVEGQEDRRFDLATRMAHYRVPGASVAIIDGCRIVDARGFGTSAGSDVPITTATLFQAGSISKTLTAVAALKLVEARKLQLDSEVRPLLADWASKDGPAGSRSPSSSPT